MEKLDRIIDVFLAVVIGLIFLYFVNRNVIELTPAIRVSFIMAMILGSQVTTLIIYRTNKRNK